MPHRGADPSAAQVLPNFVRQSVIGRSLEGEGEIPLASDAGRVRVRGEPLGLG